MSGRRPEGQHDGRLEGARGGAPEAQRPVVGAGDGLDDREADARALRRHRPGAVEAGAGAVPQRLGHARPAVDDGEDGARPLAGDGERHRRGAVAEGVVDEVLAGLGQRQRVGAAGHRVLGQVEPQVVGLGVALLDDADGDGAQVHRLVRHGVGAVDDQRVAEQLVGQPAEADGAGVDAADDGALALGVGLVGGELGLGADGGDGGAQLVRGVGDQVAHDLHLPGLPRHEAVDRRDERPDLARRGDVERRQVARLAGGEAALDPAERRQRRADGERRERRHREADQPDDEERAPGDLGGEGVAGAGGLADHDLDGAGEVALREAAGNRGEPGGLAGEVDLGEARALRRPAGDRPCR